VVEKIRKQLTGGLLKRLKRLAKNEPAAYARLWSNFGSTLKEGVHGDSENRARLLPLLRFNATRHDDDEGMISLAEYVEAMPEDQEAIWYLSGPDRDTCARSPHLEAFAARGYEVLLLTDSVDEWVVGSVTEFEGKPLKSAARGAPDLDDEGDAAEAPEGLVGWLGELLDDNVKEVRASRRLTNSPSVLVDDEHGISGNMARILQAANQSVPSGQRILEINPSHDLVRAAEALRAKGAPEAEAVGRLLLDQAQLAEGQVQDPGGMADRLRTLSHLVARAAGVEIAPIEEDIVDEATPAIPTDVQGDDEVTAVSIEPPPELTSSFNAREFSEPEAIDPEVIEEA
jgi:molecular chaperone HtpG